MEKLQRKHWNKPCSLFKKIIPKQERNRYVMKGVPDTVIKPIIDDMVSHYIMKTLRGVENGKLKIRN